MTDLSLSSLPAVLANNGLQQFLGGPIIMILALFMMMYFLIIRPQQRQRKELEARIASLKKGDKVVTIGGLHASVHHISDRTVTLKLSEGVFVPFEKTAVQSVSKASSKDEDPAQDQESSGSDSKK